MTDFTKTETNFDDFKCRCSAITMMMSNSQGNAPLTELQVKELAELEAKATRTIKQSEKITELVKKREDAKKVVLSDTCIGYLMEHYSWVTQKMVSISKEMDIQSLRKGKIQEPEGIALLSIVDGVIYQKNTQRISNDYLTGEPDIFVGEDIYNAEKVTDIKNSFDYPGFLKKIHTQVDPTNKIQIQGYLDLCNAPVGEVADVLTDMPEEMINDYRRKLLYRMNVISDQSPAYLEAVAEMERSMYFNGIPKHQRVFKKKVEPFTADYKQKVKDKVKICAQWLNEFHLMYMRLNS